MVKVQSDAHERIVLYFKHFGGFELEHVYTFM